MGVACVPAAVKVGRALPGLWIRCLVALTRANLDFVLFKGALLAFMTEVKRIGVLTGGGDAPGLNPAIKGLVYRSFERGIQTVGLSDGWLSLLNPPFDVIPLERASVRRW